MNKEPMTVRGHELLQQELKKLKGTDRPTVIRAIAEARAHGAEQGKVLIFESDAGRIRDLADREPRTEEDGFAVGPGLLAVREDARGLHGMPGGLGLRL